MKGAVRILMNYILSFSMFFYGIPLVAYSQEAAGFKGEIFYSKGNCSVYRSDGTFANVAKGFVLKSWDRVTCGPDSVAIISFGPKKMSKIKVSRDSTVDLVLKPEIPKETSFFLSKGSVLIKTMLNALSKNKTGESIVVRTKMASLGVRGTEFFTYVDNNDKVSMATNTGQVEVASTSSKKVVKVDAGNGTVTDMNNSVLDQRPVDWAKQVNWNFNPAVGAVAQSAVLYKAIEASWGMLMKSLGLFKPTTPKPSGNVAGGGGASASGGSAGAVVGTVLGVGAVAAIVVVATANKCDDPCPGDSSYYCPRSKACCPSSHPHHYNGHCYCGHYCSPQIPSGATSDFCSDSGWDKTGC